MVELKKYLKLTPAYWTSKRIMALRKRYGFSKEHFARQLGISVRTIYRWEAGKSKPSILACKILADFEGDN